jgi:hypothetical protein
MPNKKFNQVRKRAIAIQKAGGKKTVPSKKVFKVTMQTALQQASNELNAK